MRKSILRAGSALQSLAIVGAGVAGAFIIATPAAAQDYTSGAIIGTITNTSGAPVAGATVTMRSLAQNQVRSFVTDGAGNFSASGLTPGVYDITVHASGYRPYTDTLTVTAAQESRVTVGLVSVTQSATITITGRRLRQVATQATTGLNVDVTAVTQNVAVPRNITGVTLLAPTTARGVRGFGDVPSVGGGSVAENAYYINGLNITNPDTYVGSARVPFDFYKTVDIQTGGYPAEFGRATGGVLNATTKQGTNDPFVALHLNWEPEGLRGHSPNTGIPSDPTVLGRLTTEDHKSATIEAGGAVIPDHIFLYGLIQPQRNLVKTAFPSNGSYEIDRDNSPFWGAKADIYLNPTQHAEFTIFDTRDTIHITDYSLSGDTAGTIGGVTGTEINKTGGLNWVARYTGNITDFFAVSAAYGVSKDADDVLPTNAAAYYVIDRRRATTGGIAKVISQQPFATNSTTKPSAVFTAVTATSG